MRAKRGMDQLIRSSSLVHEDFWSSEGGDWSWLCEGGAHRLKGGGRTGRVAGGVRLGQRIALALMLMIFVGPSITSSQERLLPTQISVTQVPFYTSRRVQGGVAFNGTVAELKDAGYNTLAINDGRYISVELISDGNGAFLEGPVLERRFGVTASNGLALFDNLVVKKVCSQCRLRFVSGSLQTFSVAFDVTQGPPSGMTFRAFPTTGAVGIDVDPQPSLQVIDRGGNVVFDPFTVVAFLAAGNGQIRQRFNNLVVQSVGADNFATFNRIFFDNPSEVTMGFNATFADGTMITFLKTGLKVTGIASDAHLNALFVPFSKAAVVPFDVQPTITLFDFFGTQVTADTDSKIITATIRNGTAGARLLGNTSVRTVGGVATFTDLAVDKVGVDYFLHFQVETVINVTSRAFNITPGIAQRLVIIQEPTTIVAGLPFSPTLVVAVQDAGGNNVPGVFAVGVEVHAEYNTGNATVVGTGSALVNTIDGVSRFPDISIDKVGEQRLVFFLGGGFQQLSQPFEVLPGVANIIKIGEQPGAALRGRALSRAPTVILLDRFGNFVLSGLLIYEVSVKILANPGSGTLGGTLTQPFVGGLAVFNDLNINNIARGYSLRFTANGTLSADSQTFDITGTATSVVVLTQPRGAVGGDVFRMQPQVAAIDIAGLVVATRVSTVSVSIGTNPGGGSLTPARPMVVTRLGVASFEGISINRAGVGYTLVFSVLDMRGHPVGSVSSEPFDVTVGPAAALSVSQQPLTILVAGQLYQPVAEASVVDAGGNIVNITLGDMTAEVYHGGSPISQLTASVVEGTAIFDSALNLSGTNFRLLFTYMLPSSATASVSSIAFDVRLGPAAAIVVTTQPTAVIANVVLQSTPFIVSIIDAGGNSITNYGSPVTVSRATGPSGSYVFGNLTVSPTGGVVAFTGIYISDTAASYSLEFTTKPSPTSNFLTTVSQPFAVTLPANSLRVEQAPRFAKGGETLDRSIIVSFRDVAGAVVKSLSEAVYANISTGPAGAILHGTWRVSAVAGLATFTDLMVEKAGMYTIRFLGTDSGLAATTQLENEVGQPWNLFLSMQPKDAMDSTLFHTFPTVSVLDKGGNVVPSAFLTVRATLMDNSEGAVLRGDLTVDTVGGQATFKNMSIAGIGSGFTILFTAGSFQVESIQFSVHGTAVKHLSVISFPAGVIWTRTIQAQVRVAILDEAFNVITGGTNRPPYVRINCALHAEAKWTYYGTFQTPRLVVAGTTTAVVREGIANFDGLSISGDGGGAYHGIRLTFSSNVSSATVSTGYFSATNSENRLLMDRDVLHVQSSGVSLTPFPRILVVDGVNKPVRGSIVTVTASLTDPNTPAVLEGTVTVKSAGGFFTFTDLSISRATGAGDAPYQIEFKANSYVFGGQTFAVGITKVTSSTFSVSIGAATSLRVEAPPLFGASGALLLSQPCIALVDAGNNLILTEAPVNATLQPSSATERLVGQITVTSSDGKASFTDLRVHGAVLGRSYSIIFSSGRLETRSAAFLGAPGVPHVSIITKEPPVSLVAAKFFDPPPIVSVHDAGGTPVKDGTPVVASLVGAPSGSVVSSATAHTFNGSAVFTGLSVQKAGSGIRLRFSCLSAPFVDSRQFSVSIGTAAFLSIGVQPRNSVFGVPLNPSPSIGAVDLGGNLVTPLVFSATVSLIPPALDYNHALSAVLTGVTSQESFGGRVVFPGIAINDAGAGYRLKFSTPGLPSVTSEAFDITGPPALLRVDLQPLGPQSSAGKAAAHVPLFQQPVVHVADFGGALVSSVDVPAGVLVTMEGGGSLSGGTTVDVVRGVARFVDLTVRTAGPAVRLVFAYQGPQLETSVRSEPLTVLSGPVASLTILQQPSSGVRGVRLGKQPQVAILDAYGNRVTWYQGTATAILFGPGQTPTSSVLVGTGEVPLVDGKGTFTDLMMTDYGVGFELRFTAAGWSAVSDPIGVNTGPPAGLKLKFPIAGGATTLGNGRLAPSPMVQVVDDGGGVVQSFSGVGGCTGADCAVFVKIVCCPLDQLGNYIGTGVLTGATRVIAVNGEATFGDLAIATVGEYKLQFQIAEISGISLSHSVTSPVIPVQLPSTITLDSQPGQAVLGLPMRSQPVLKVRDASGAVVNGSDHSVGLSIVSGVGCTAITGTTPVRAVRGVASFTDITITAYTGNILCKFNFTMSSPAKYVLSSDFTISFGPASLSVTTQPSPGSAGAALATQPQVNFADPTGSLLLTEQGRAVIAELEDGGRLLGRTSVPMLDGYARFTDLTVPGVSAAAKLRFIMGFFAVSSNAFAITQGGAASLVITQQPSDVQTGAPITPNVAVQAIDAGENLATAYVVDITAAVFPSGALGAALTGNVVTPSSGVAIFSLLSIDTACRMLQLQFTSGALSVTTQPFTVHGAPDFLTVENFPPEAISAQSITPRVQISLYDIFGIFAITRGDTIIASIEANAAGATLDGNVTLAAAAGVAYFSDLSVAKAASGLVLRFSLATDANKFVLSPPINVVNGPVAALIIVAQPVSTPAGRIISPFPSVQAVDAQNNLVVAAAGQITCCVLDDATGGCRPNGGRRVMQIVAGIATFTTMQVSIPPDANARLLFDAGSGVTVTSASFEVWLGAPALQVLRQPAGSTAGRPFLIQPVVYLADPSGNALALGTGSLEYLEVTATLSAKAVPSAELSDEDGVCPCKVSFAAGSGTFSGLKISVPGSYFQITFTSPLLVSASTVSDYFTVTGDAIYPAYTVAPPTSIQHGVLFPLKAHLVDPNLLEVAAPNITISLLLASNRAAPAPPATITGTTLASALSGFADFGNVAITAPGVYVIRLQSGGLGGDSLPITVNPGNPSIATLAPLPERIIAAEAIFPSPKFTLLDSGGFVSANFSGAALFSLLHSNGSMLQSFPAIVGNGIALCDIFVPTLVGGPFTMSASAAGLTAVSPEFFIFPGKLDSIVLVTPPGNGIDDFPLAVQPVVEARDAVGNLLTAFNGQIVVTVASSASPVAFIGDSFAQAVNGRATFSELSLDNPSADIALVFSTPEACGRSIQAANISVTLPAVSIAVAGSISDVSGGRAFGEQPRIALLDTAGNTVLASSQVISAEVCPGTGPVDSGPLRGTLDVPATLGVGIFTDLTLDIKGNYRICFTSASFNKVNISVTVTQGLAAAIYIIDQPPPKGIRAGEVVLGPRVQVRDAGGNLLLTSTPLKAYIIDTRTRGKVARIMNGLNGTYFEGSVDIAVSGTVITNLKLERPGIDYRIKLSYEPGGVEFFSVTTDLFEVSVGRCSFLKVISQPGGGFIGVPFARPLMVEKQDTVGNGVGQDTGPVTVYISARAGKNHFTDATISGCPITVIPIDGVATFIGCQINCNVASQCAGINYELVFVGACEGASQTVYSESFTVSLPPNEIRFRDGTVANPGPASAQAGVPFAIQPVIEMWTKPCGATAASECLVTPSEHGASVTATVDGGADVLGTATVPVVNGVATFTNLAIDIARVTPYSLSFTRNGTGTVLAGLSTMVTVSTGAAASLVITSQPSLTGPGQTFGCTAELRDVAGMLVLDAAQDVFVTIELADDFGLVKPPTLRTSQNSLTQQSSAGVVTWTGLVVDVAPVSYTFKISATLVSGARVSTVSDRIALAIGTLGELRFRHQPHDVESGVNFSPDIVVYMYDAGGNLLRGSAISSTVTLSLQTGSGSLVGNVSQLSEATIGIATFPGISITYTAGKNTHEIKATSGSQIATTNPFFVHAAPSALVLRAKPTPGPLVGVPFPVQPVVELRDGQANRARYESNCTVNVSAGLLNATFRGTKTVNCYKGLATFTDLSASMVGSYTLTFMSSLGAFNVASSALTVTAGPPRLLRVAANYQPANSGTALGGEVLPVQPRIELLDLGSGAATGGKGLLVEARIKDYPAGRTFDSLHALFGTVTVAADADGVAKFTDLAINVKGIYTIRFILAGIATIDSDAFTVLPGPVATLAYVNQPSDGVFGIPLATQPRVKLMDLGGNLVRGTPWLHVALRSGEGKLSGCDRALAAEDSGIVQFEGCLVDGTGVSGERTIVVQTAETGNILSGTIIGNEILSLISEPFIISGVPSTISILTRAAGARSRSPFPIQPVVQILDSSGYLVASSTAEVKAAWWYPNSLSLQTLAGTSVVNAVGGVATFADLSLSPPGPGGLVFWLNNHTGWDGPLEGVNGTEVDYNVTNHTMNICFNRTVFTCPNVTTNCLNWTASNCSRNSSLSNCINATNCSDIPECTPPPISALDVLCNLTDTQNVVVLPAAPFQVTLFPPPIPSVPAGIPFTPSDLTATLRDPDGVPSAPFPLVPFSIAAGGCPVGSCLHGASNIVMSPHGHTATFPAVSISTVGTYTITVSAGLLSAPSFTITIVPDTAANLLLVQDFPPAAFASHVISPAPSVRLVDRFDNTVEGYAAPITIQISLAPISNPKFAGLASVNAVLGIASFSGISFPIGGSGFQMRFSSVSEGISTSSRVFTISYPHTFLEFSVPLPASVPASAPMQAEGGGDTGLTVFLNDDSGLRTLASNQVVTISVVGGTSPLGGITSVAAVEGVARFPDLAIMSVGVHRLFLSSTNGASLVTLTSPSISVTPGTPSKLVISREPGGLLQGGDPFPVQPVILVADLGGNLVSSSLPITASILTDPTGNGELVGNVSAFSGGIFGFPLDESNDGALTFSGLGITSAGVGYVLRFTSPGLTPADTSALTVIVGKATRLKVSTQPGGVFTAITFATQPVITINDRGGNMVTQGLYEVTASVHRHGVDQSLIHLIGLYGVTTVTSANGLATFNTLLMNQASFFCVLRFTSPGFLSVDSDSFSIAPTTPLSSCPGAQGSIALCGPDLNKVQLLVPMPDVGFANALAAIPLAPLVIRVHDWDGNLQVTSNGTIQASITTGTGHPDAVLSGAVSQVIDGIATFSSLTIDKASTTRYTLTVVYGSLRTVTSAVTVRASTASSLSLGAIPIQLPANTPIPQVTATLLDAGQNIASDSRCQTVSLVVLSGPYVFSASSAANSTAGSYLVTATMSTPGVYTIRCDCSVAGVGVLSSPSQSIWVLPYGLPVGVAFVTQPGAASLYVDPGTTAQVYDIIRSPVVRLVDASGNTLMGFVGFFRATASGSGTTGLVLGEGDAYTFWATNGMATLDGFYVSLTSGTPADGSLIVAVGSSCCSLLAASVTNPSARSNLTGGPTHLNLVLHPTPSQAGESFALTVSILTALSGGSPVSAYSSLVECNLLSSGSPAAAGTLHGTTSLSATAGVASFTPLTITVPGSYTISCTAPIPGWAGASLTAATSLLTIAVGPARGLKFATQPGGCLGGTPCTTQPIIGLVDGAGNAVATAGVVISVSLLPPSVEFPGPSRRHSGRAAVLGGTLVATTDGTGFAAIPSMSISYAGAGYKVVATATGLTSATSKTVSVLVGAIMRATIIREASGLTASVPYYWQPILTVSDAGGNWISGTRELVQADTLITCATSSDPNCRSFGNMTVNSTDGVARFTDLGVNYAGRIQLRFKLSSITSCGLGCWSLGNTLDVIPGEAAKLSIITPVSAAVCAASSIPAITVQVQDAAGNPVQNGVVYTVTVTLSVTQSTLLGTKTQQTSAGTATFSGLAVRRACGLVTPKTPLMPCYNLTFHSMPGDLSATSSSFSVLAGNATYLAYLDQPINTSVGTSIGRPSVMLTDNLGNPIGQGSQCGSFTALFPDDATPMSAEYQLTGSVDGLGWTSKNGTNNETVSFIGASVDWNVRGCPKGGGDCSPANIADLSKIRMRATWRYLAFMADSEVFTVDVAQPANVRASATNLTHVTLTWNAPFHGPAPGAYRLQYGPLGGAAVSDVRDIRTTTYTIGPLPTATMYSFGLCSQSALDSPACSPFPPAPQIASALQPVPSLKVYFVTTDTVGLRWDAPAGPPPTAYKVTMTTGAGLEMKIGDDTEYRNMTIRGLNSNGTYSFRVYPLSPATGGAFYAPTSPFVPPVTPTPAPTGTNLVCGLGSPPCSGTSLTVSWTPQGGANAATAHKVIATQWTGGEPGGINSTLVYSSERLVLASDSLQLSDITGLQRGVNVTIDIMARSTMRPSYFAPSATFNVVPTSPPAPPTGLAFAVENNTEIRASWNAPLDTGDGTPNGVYIDAYKLEYKAASAVSWTLLNIPNPRALTQTISGLIPGTTYQIRVSARGQPSPGEKCLAGICTNISLPSEYGPVTSGTVLFGSVPEWVTSAAPARQNPPQLLKLFVGTRFEFNLSAVGVDAGQNITISAAGLQACGARLVDVFVGNPATATLRMDPALREMDKTYVICFTAADSLGAYSEPRCLRLQVAAPRPRFVSPIQNQNLIATIGCPTTIDFSALDTTSADVSVELANDRGYQLSIGFVSSSAISAYGTVTSYSLPQGSAFSGMDGVFTNPQTRRLTWTPLRGQEAFEYSFCVKVEDSLRVLNTASGELTGPYCITLSVQRCTYCLVRGDSLQSVADAWGTHWLNLWAGNPNIVNPSTPLAGTPLLLGPVFLTSVHDSLSGLAIRTGVSEEHILSWNPDLALAVATDGTVQLQEDKEVCLLPSMCVN